MKTALTDFPDWLGPMLVKELRQGLKTRGFVLSFIGLQVVLVLVLVFNVLIYARDPRAFSAGGLGAIYWFLIGGLLLIVTPLRAFNELASERKANTLELIFMSGLSAWRITFGKWVSFLFQALLFLLAVLPYAILRYYFGAVDLAQDLGSMGFVLLSCGVLTACALALSGMAFWVRLIIGIIVILYLLSALIAMSVGPMFGSGSRFTLWTDGPSWVLIAWDFVLACLIALQIGAQTIAPPAENHAGRQRFLALLLWLPVLAMHATGASANAIHSQLYLFSFVATVLVWHGLATPPSDLRIHSQPFAGWRVLFGIPFQPGWPSTVVFALIEVALFEYTLNVTGTHDWKVAAFLMDAAALLCACLVWRALRRGAKHPLVEQTILQILSAAAVALLFAGKPAGMHLGDAYWSGVFPPMAICTMLDQSDPAVTSLGWMAISLFALVGYALVLLVLSRAYWARYFRFCRAAARPSAAS